MGRFAADLYARALAAVRGAPGGVVPKPAPDVATATAESPTPINVAAALCKRFEGFRSRPYLCPAGVPTIGYGATHYLNGVRVTLKDPPITQEMAERLLLAQLERVYLPQVFRLCPALRQQPAERVAAIIDFTFNLGAGNLGTSTLRRRINAGAWALVPHELAKWVFAAGQRLRGLALRRDAEIALVRKVK